MTTFDRYLLRRFFHVFCIGFLAIFGLFVVFDNFTNVDEFQDENAKGGIPAMLLRMAEYYGYQSFLILDLIGAILGVISIMVVFATLQRNGELNPILSAGVPTYRLVRPFLVGVLGINAVLIVNQEVIIPRIANHLQAPRGKDSTTAQRVEAVIDFKTGIDISGKELFIADRKLLEAEFVLPVPAVSQKLTTLKAEEAIYYQGHGERPSGWAMHGVSPAYGQLDLSEEGKKFILPLKDSDGMFVITDVNFDQLYKRGTSYRYLSTAELIGRIRNPTFGLASVRSQRLHLHERLTRPFMLWIAIYLAVPLIIRKESRELVANLAICTAVMGAVFGASQGCLYLARINFVAPDVAVWVPIISSGTLCAWMSGFVQT